MLNVLFALETFGWNYDDNNENMPLMMIMITRGPITACAFRGVGGQMILLLLLSLFHFHFTLFHFSIFTFDDDDYDYKVIWYNINAKPNYCVYPENWKDK